jgi:hypothetical protein
MVGIYEAQTGGWRFVQTHPLEVDFREKETLKYKKAVDEKARYKTVYVYVML